MESKLFVWGRGPVLTLLVVPAPEYAYDAAVTMSTIDPAQERQRLLAHYASLPDESLLQLAADLGSLTDVARDALTTEMDRRALSDAPSDSPAPESASNVASEESRGMVTITEFRDMVAALPAKGALDSAGIECVLLNSNMVRLNWFISNLLGGVQLQVRPEDADAATEILNQSIPESFDVEGVGDFEQPRCPKCNSLEVTFEELNKPIAYGTAYMGLPMPIKHNVWKCDACGQHWQEVPDPTETEKI